MNEQATQLVNELMTANCACGGKKGLLKSFCLRCYNTLTVNQQRALYRRVGNGYEEAYADARGRLIQNGRIPHVKQTRSDGGLR